MTTYTLDELRRAQFPRDAQFMHIRNSSRGLTYHEATNVDRAEWARLALEAFGHRTRQLPTADDLSRQDWADPEQVGDEILGDFLGDLMHLVGEEVFDRLVERGRGYYLEEIAEEQQDQHT